MIWLLTQPPENHSLGIDASTPETTPKTIFCWSPFCWPFEAELHHSLMRLRARQKEVSESEDQVDGKELQALEPVGSSVTRNLGRD